MSLPIVVLHQGNPFYLKNCLHHAKVYNPDSKIYLLGDESNRNFADEQILHVNIADYFSKAKAFEQLYKHQTTNPYHYNLFCFQRWFVLREFMEAMHLEHVFVCESDELLFCDITKESLTYLESDFTIVCNSFVNSIVMNYKGCVKLTDFLVFAYTDEGVMTSNQDYYSNFFHHGKRVRMGGVDDMRLFNLYLSKCGENVALVGTPVNNSCWDTAIHHANGFLMEKGIKKITWIDDLPYATYKNGELVRMLGLHFLGGNKMKEYLFMVDDNKKHINPRTLRWFMTKQWIIKIFNGLKRLPFFTRRFVQKLTTAFWRKWYDL
ncbi:MAG: hypothetical protein SPL47_04995 [Bacteroidales bacterium]|nr:hypothetical protein [Bacteroidales bacterium]